MERDAAAKAVDAERKPESRSPARREQTATQSPHPILQLQHTIGNRAVGQFLQAKFGQPVQRKQIASPPLSSVGECCDRDETTQTSSPAGAPVANEPCPDCERQIQRKSTGAAAAGAAAIPLLPSGTGTPLKPEARASFEQTFDRDFSSVRLHTGTQAAELARARNALAYTTGSNIVFGAGSAEQSKEGRHLLAHELAHVVQQAQHGAAVANAGGESLELEREADEAADRAVSGRHVGKLTGYSGALPQRKGPKDEPADCTMTASLHGFWFTPAPGAKYHDGFAHSQLLAMVLKKLLGGAYTPEFRDEVIAKWGEGGKQVPIFEIGEKKQVYTLEDIRGPAVKEGQRPDRVFWDPLGFSNLIDLCGRLGKPVTLPPEKQRFLELGKAVALAYPKIQASGDPPPFPPWFSPELFTAVMASRASLLTSLVQAAKSEAPPGADAMAGLLPGAAPGPKTQGVLITIESNLAGPVYAVENVRIDETLVGHPAYQMLWPAEKKKGDKKPVARIAPEDRVPALSPAAGLIAYADARPRLAGACLIEPNARKQLLDGFLAASGYKKTWDPSKGDQQLLEMPTQFTAPPYPSTLSVYPPLELGLYGSTRAEYGFNMALEFPNVFAAFQFHDYDFTAFRVPDDKLINVAEAEKGRGRRASHWATLKSRLARDERYHEADVKAYANTLWDQIGPPGKTADLIHLNAIMRELGTIVGSIIDTIFDPSYVARFDFPDEGLYVVRCVASWEPHEEVALRRPPSVAYQVMFARDPEALAEMVLQEQLEQEQSATARIAEINKLLTRKGLTPKHREELEKERAQLQASTGGVEALLNYQLTVLGATDEERAEKIKLILGRRKTLDFGPDTQRLPGVYVNDSGQMIELLLELRVHSEDAATGTGDYEVNDATTPLSISARRSGKRADAIVAALEAIFKSSDYGRGKASVRVDGVLKAIDIPTVSAGKLFTEALGHISTILMVIAIAAAPLTGGASMVLMVPAMVIGAIPSAYNIIQRGLDHTLHADLALAMDIVNVVGALVGVGAETRVGMQAIRLGTTTGKVLIVTGIGAMGASVLLMQEQVRRDIDALQDMPEGLRRAEVMKILGKAMFNAGIMIGGVLAAHARAAEGRPATFDEWLGELDQATRDRIEASKTETNPAKNFWKFYSEMDPAVRDLLTQCGSYCAPMDPLPSKPDIARIEKIEKRLTPAARRRFKGLLHENRAPAAMDAILRSIEESVKKAPRSKGGAKKAAAAESAVQAHSTAADYILAEFSEEPVNNLDPNQPDPAKWGRVRKLAEEVAAAGKFALEDVGAILDRVRQFQGADPEEILGLLKKLGDIAGKAKGIDKILGSKGLSGGHTFFKGARWTLRFIAEANLWESVKEFEEPTAGMVIARVIDIRLVDGTRIEMKSWTEWHDVGEVHASQQLMEDFRSTGGFTDAVQWRFEPGEGIGTSQDVIDKLKAALDKALEQKRRGFDDPDAANRVAAIKLKLPQIVKVGAK